MIGNKMFFFHVQAPYSFHQILYLRYALTNINSSKKTTKSLNKHCTLQNILQNVLFFFTNLSQGNFLYFIKFFILIKSLNIACVPAKMKQNLLH